MARWYSRDCAEITTHLGRQYIQKTIEEAENFGFKVIYADTDGFYSKWANGEKLTKDELLEKTTTFLKTINDKLPGEMELEFEGYFKRGIFVTKKKYALIDENEKITVKGLEVVRRDWSNVSKNTQKNVLNALLKEGSVENAVITSYSIHYTKLYEYDSPSLITPSNTSLPTITKSSSESILTTTYSSPKKGILFPVV